MRECTNNAHLRKFWMTMKLTIYLFFVAISQIMAVETYSQSTRLSLNLKSVAVKDVLDKIEKNSEFIFLYNSKLVDVNQKVSVDYKDQKISDVLDDLFRKTDIIYTIVDRQIVLANNTERNNLLETDGQQQKKSVSGKVTDSSGSPLPGVTVLIKGTTTGIITDSSGKYSLLNLPENAELQFSFVGMQMKEVVVDGKVTINVVLEESNITVDEVVAVGYGSMKRADVTGAMVSISSEKITALPITNLEQALQGRVAGIDVVPDGSTPGSGVTVRIRGRRSFSASNDPLYVLDGIPMTGDMADINPNDIESMDVLKDASATAIYGSRGANGVVLITTKRGKVGKPSLSYSMYVGVTSPEGKYSVLNGQQYEKYRVEAFRTIGQEPTWAPIELESTDLGRSTNWQDLILGNGLQQQYDLNLTGGTENTQYSVNGSYLNEKGVISLQDFSRYNFKVSLNQKVGTRLNLGFSSFATMSIRNGQDYTPLSNALMLSPLTVPYDAAGNLIFFPNPSETIMKNPLADLVPDALVDETKQSRIFASMFAEYNLTKDLTARVNFGPSLTSYRRGNFAASATSIRSENVPSASATNSTDFSYTLENILNYKKKIDKHSFGATALFSVQTQQDESFSSSVEGVTVDAQKFYNMGNASTILGVASNYAEWAILSYMGRLNYGYKDRYLVTVTTRADGSSRLAEGNKWGFFPSMALAWRISEEEFLKNFKKLDNLKIRTGYGSTGNTGIMPYATQGALLRKAYSFGTTSAFGFYPSEFRNLDLKWETTSSVNLGVDFSFFKSRVSGSIDVYHQNTTDLLMNRQIPANSGFTSVLSNIGATRNRGLEISLTTVNVESKNGFSWESDFSFYTNREEIVSLSTGKEDDPQNGWFIGHPITVYYDYEKTGIWQTADEALSLTYNSKPGEIRLKDQNNDGEINSLDKVILGSDVPKWTGSMTNRFKYKAFDFSVLIYTRQGSMIQSSYHESLGALSGKGNIMDMDYWTPENPTNMWPRPNKNQERPTNSSTLTYFSGSFVKVRNMQLGYNLPKPVMDKLKMESLRLYISAQQPFILFSSYVNKYHGIDPEIDRSVGFNTPPVKAFMIGLNARF